MTNKRKKLIGLLTLGLLFVAGIAGTFAYLTDKTETKSNTFTIGKVGISLAEPKWDAEGASHKIIPGVTLDKDPQVTVKANSEESYVFISVDTSAGLNDYVTAKKVSLDYSPDWTLVETVGTTKVYTYKNKVASRGTDNTLSPIFTKITFSGDLTKADLAELSTSKIDVKASAIQASGFNTATEAWAKLKN